MRADSAPDHGSLALLAQRDAAAELRPLLLRVQVQSFASVHRRDAATLASFETIALGLIPLVPDDAVAEAAAILRDVEDVPASVIAALAERKGRDGETKPLSREPTDLAIASSGEPLDPRALADLVEEAAGRPDLAALLLARPEPTVFDRAALYRHADAATREAIRLDLALALATIRPERPPGAAETGRAIIALAEAGDPALLIDAVAAQVRMGAGSLEIVSEAGQELFVFALAAIGLEPEDVTRTLLVCGAPLSHSVGCVFRLTRLAQSVSPPVAAYLVGQERIAPRPYPTTGAEPSRAAGTLRADGRADPVRPLMRTALPRRDRAPIARADRRS
jgi:hypothetical protein